MSEKAPSAGGKSPFEPQDTLLKLYLIMVSLCNSRQWHRNLQPEYTARLHQSQLADSFEFCGVVGKTLR